jgi:hypothetical protein
LPPGARTTRGTLGLIHTVHSLDAVKIQLEKYSKALEERKITVDLDDSAAAQLVRTAFNPTMGARPVKRLLERVVMTSLSRLVRPPHPHALVFAVLRTLCVPVLKFLRTESQMDIFAGMKILCRGFFSLKR